MGGWVEHVRQWQMAKQKMNLTHQVKPHDLNPLHSDFQPCVRKTFSASFVPQPVENHTSPSSDWPC